MVLLRHLRHGPLAFWSVVVAALVAVSAFAVSYAPTTAVPAAAAPSMSDVEQWRATSAQLPAAAAQGSTHAIATVLADVAEEHARTAQSAAATGLASAWQYAAATANELAATDPADREAVDLAVHAVGLAGDALAAASSGTPWLVYGNTGSQPSGIDGRPTA